MKGKKLDEVLTIKNTHIASHLKLPPVKLHCSMLAEDAIKAAVNDYIKKNPGSTVKAASASDAASAPAAAAAKLTQSA